MNGWFVIIPFIILVVWLFDACIRYVWRNGYLNGVKQARNSRKLAKEAATIHHSFQEAMQKELKRARTLHPEEPHSVHEGYGLLSEEVREFFDEVCRKEKDQDIVAMYKELVQIAVVAQRTAESLHRLQLGRKHQ